MADKQPTVLKVAHLDEKACLTLGDVCRVCEVHADWVFELVAEGVLEPIGRRPADWRFSGGALRRAHAARRLQRDLNVNIAGVALALELLEDIKDLRARLQTMEHEPLIPDE